MKAVGEKVKIRSKKWYTAHCEDKGELPLVPEMYEFFGKEAKILRVWRQVNCYDIDIDGGEFFWIDDWFEPLAQGELL